jgi:hypothetical protein
MPKVLEVIWGDWEQKYLSENQKKDSTALETASTGKSLEPVLSSICRMSLAAPTRQIWTNGQVIRPGDHSPKHSSLYIQPASAASRIRLRTIP